jgi:glycosyltransferase involved in cell wall biosynthesis
MQRFADCLRRELPAQGVEVEFIQPEPRVGQLRSGGGIGKWLAYVDKFLLFPRTLRRRFAAGDCDVAHILDHSNAIYNSALPRHRTVVTCHDMLAIRGALGEDVDCPASRTGKILQQKILAGLKRAGCVACVSTATQKDFLRLAGTGVRSLVALNGLNQSFRKLPEAEVTARLRKLPALDLARPFLLHLGSSLKRKNRALILRVMARIKDRWRGVVVLAGAPLSPEERALRDQLGIADRVVEIVGPDQDAVEALYNRAHALVFPSKSEGFGWPITEAQACGCPVICSNTTSLPEVAGDGAVVLGFDDEAGFAKAVIALDDPATRAALIQRGDENVKRFTTERMVRDYVAIYREMLKG